MRSHPDSPSAVARLCAIGSLALAVGVAACTTTVPETGRRQVNFMDPAEEASMGLAEFEKIKEQKPISRDPRYTRPLRRVGDRLAEVMPVPNAEWEFVVFEDPTPNAFALPGGKVGVHTGLFQITENDAGLAAVIGHEVAHVVARHSGERLSRGMLSTAAVAGAGYMLKRDGDDNPLATAALGGGALVASRGFSRKQELEADRMGAIFMARAGYDPRESVELWKRFAAWRRENESGPETPDFLRTHPLDEERIAELERYLPEAMADYEGGT